MCYAFTHVCLRSLVLLRFVPKVAEAFELCLDPTHAGGAAVPGEHNVPMLRAVASLDTCVTVVDAGGLLHALEDIRNVSEVERSAPQEDCRSIAHLMVDQLEFANVILLNKCDLVDEPALHRLEALIHTLNPDTAVYRTVQSRVDPSKVVGTGLFSLEAARAAPGRTTGCISLRDSSRRKV